MRKLKNYKPTRFMAEGSYYDYQCANAKGYKGRLSVEFDAAGNTLRDTIKIADVRKLEE